MTGNGHTYLNQEIGIPDAHAFSVGSMHGLYESGLREAAEWASPIDQHYYLSWLQSRSHRFGGDMWVDLFDSRSTPGSSSGCPAYPIPSKSMVP